MISLLDAKLVPFALALWLVYKVIYAKFLSPTKHVPGSLIDKMFGLRFFLSTVSGQKMYFAHKQVLQHGSLVEIAPNILACNSINDIKTIYGSHEWRKSRFYSDFADFNGTSSLFSETHKERAQALRRCFLPAFSRANLVAMSDRIFAHLRKFLVKLDEFDRRGEALDAYVWTRYLTFEVVTDVGFGADYDMINTGELDHPFVKDFDQATAYGVFVSMMPFLKYIPHWLSLGKVWKELQGAEGRVIQHAQGGLRKWQDGKPEATGTGSPRVDILQRLIEYGEVHPEDKLTEKELITEIMEIMLAGGDTTSNTLTYGCWELARNPDAQQKLITALRQGLPDPSNITLQDLEAIPYLDYTVKEMLRSHPTLPSLLERVVPPKGAVINGIPLPGGTVVAMSAHTMNQNEMVFPDAGQFQPDRWAEKSSQMETNLLTFSTGPRSCVGQNLATTQIKIHMGLIFRTFCVKLHPDTSAASMLAQDMFQGKPRSGKCMLYFQRISKAGEMGGGK